VALVPFVDTGIDSIVRTSQLQIAQVQYDQVIGTPFGCPQLDAGYNCAGGSVLSPTPSKYLQVLGATNWKPRMSTGLELQMFLPVINAPFRIYWAYNPLRLNTPASPPIPITPEMFPGSRDPITGAWQMTAAGAYTYKLATETFAPSFLLREPRKTFRFTVATTF
jgi:outer membrane protein insertion porin family